MSMRYHRPLSMTRSMREKGGDALKAMLTIPEVKASTRLKKRQRRIYRRIAMNQRAYCKRYPGGHWEARYMSVSFGWLQLARNG